MQRLARSGRSPSATTLLSTARVTTRAATLATLLASALIGGPLGLPGEARAGWDDWKKKLEDAVDDARGGESSSDAGASSQSAAPDAAADAGAASTFGGGFDDLQLDAGLREALKVGAERAVQSLGREDGFLGNAELRLPLPEKLEPAAKLLKRLGQGKRVDEFVVTLNRAAERAVPRALPILEKAVSDLGWEDVKAIFDGSDDAATQYLQRCCSADLLSAFQPVVAEATREAGVSAAYQSLSERASGLTGGFGLPDIDAYVTREAVDGLFATLAVEEGRIREDPGARTTELLQQIFN